MSKKWSIIFTLLLAFVLVFNTNGEVKASTEVKLMVEGQHVEPDVPAQIKNERTFVPIRFIAENMGAQVNWNQSEKRIDISQDTIRLTLYLDQNVIHVNGQAQRMDTAPFVERNRTMVPLRFVSEYLGMRVGWDNKQKQVFISSHRVDLLVSEERYDDPQRGSITASEEIHNHRLHDVTVENGRYVLHVPGLDANKIVQQWLRSPRRLVLDLPQTQLVENMNTVYPLSDSTVERVRVSQFSSSPMTVRVVFDLKKRTKVSIQAENGKIYLQFEDRKPLAVIDAGHGGRDPGASGSFSQEKQVALAISNRIMNLLEQDPEIEVKATRTTDEYLTLNERAAFANQVNADLFLSVHANAASRSTVGGTETYIYYNEDRTFGSIVHRHLIQATGLQDRGLKEADFAVLRETSMPAALIEIAFMSNPAEEKLLNDPAFQDKVAQAMYQAIREYEIGK